MRVDATSQLRDDGAFGDVIAALEAHRCVKTDVEAHGMAHCNLAAAYWDHGDHRRAYDHAQRALTLVEGSDTEAELLVRAGLAMYRTRVQFDGAAALHDVREALRIANRRGQHIAFARARLAAALLVTGDPCWRTEIDEAVASAVADGDVVGERLARESRYVHAFVSGDLETALTDIAVVTDGRALRDRPAKGRHLGFRLLIDLMKMGDSPAIVDGANALLAERPIFDQRVVAVAAGAVAATGAGRPDIAERLIATVVPTDPEEAVVMAWANAELSWATGRHASPTVGSADAAPALHPAMAMTAVASTWAAVEAGTELPEPPVVSLPGFAPAVAETRALHRLAAGETAEVVYAFDEAAASWWSGTDRRGALRCAWGLRTPPTGRAPMTPSSAWSTAGSSPPITGRHPSPLERPSPCVAMACRSDRSPPRRLRLCPAPRRRSCGSWPPGSPPGRWRPSSVCEPEPLATTCTRPSATSACEAGPRR